MVSERYRAALIPIASLVPVRGLGQRATVRHRASYRRYKTKPLAQSERPVFRELAVSRAISADRKLLYRRTSAVIAVRQVTPPVRARSLCGFPQLPRLAPAFVTAVSEARTAATVLRGSQRGSRRCLRATTPPVQPIASKRRHPVALI